MSAAQRHRDAALASILDGLTPILDGTCLAQQRGGIARCGDVGWAECSGRDDEDCWLELKLHHHPVTRTLNAGLLAYAPMRHGGGTEILGECFWRYLDAPDEVIRDAVKGVGEWLAPLKRGRP